MTGRITHGLADVEPTPSAVTLGFFDGVHTGHRATVGRAVVAAAERGLRAVAMTFDPHPLVVLKGPEHAPRLLCSARRRAELLLDCGVDLVVVLPFDETRARQPHADFEGEVLERTLRARHVVVGENFTYGHRARGSVTTLRSWADAHGARLHVQRLVRAMDGATVSSSEIRRRLAVDGDVTWARAALGRPFALSGPVVAGEGRGRTIGFPTANVAIDDRLLVPAHGVYAGWVSAGGARSPMVANIGSRPTFAGTGTSVEVHLLADGRDLYGQTVVAELEHRLRRELRFDGVDDLVAQIDRDVMRARELLGAW